jgi:hypothetical protein
MHERQRTFSARGEKQRKLSAVEHQYTDNIFTAVSLDGSIIPPHAFTANPALAPGSQRLAFLCDFYHVHPDQVVYWNKEKGKWVGETAAMAAQVVQTYDWTDCHVLTDEGNSWKPAGENLLLEYDAARVETMPPAPHGDISPLDNCYHAVAKNAERASRPPNARDDEITIRLLSFLGQAERSAIRSYWNKNFMLDHKKPTLKAYIEHLKGHKLVNKDRQALHKNCRTSYTRYMAQKDE